MAREGFPDSPGFCYVVLNGRPLGKPQGDVQVRVVDGELIGGTNCLDGNRSHDLTQLRRVNRMPGWCENESDGLRPQHGRLFWHRRGENLGADVVERLAVLRESGGHQRDGCEENERTNDETHGASPLTHPLRVSPWSVTSRHRLFIDVSENHSFLMYTTKSTKKQIARGVIHNTYLCKFSL